MKETQMWDKNGDFSSSGIVVGTFGVGAGMGSGTYNEHGQTRSKRAEVMDEPQQFQLPYTSLIVGALLTGFLLVSAPSILPNIGIAARDGAAQSNFAVALTPVLLKIVGFIAVPAALLLLVRAWLQAEKNIALEDKLNRTEYPKQLARYNDLRYCVDCNVLYDSNRNAAMANQIGFASMMQMA